MKPIASLFPTERPKSKINSERADIIKIFVDKINAGRPCKYKDAQGKIRELKPLTARAIACRVGYLKTNADLYYLDSVCRASKNYSQLFFYLTKSKKVDCPRTA